MLLMSYEQDEPEDHEPVSYAEYKRRGSVEANKHKRTMAYLEDARAKIQEQAKEIAAYAEREKAWAELVDRLFNRILCDGGDSPSCEKVCRNDYDNCPDNCPSNLDKLLADKTALTTLMGGVDDER
jgi:hypothetical protein